jgi:protein O-GlcNAc transferase
MWAFLVSLLSLLPGASAYSATPTFLEANEAFENGDLKNAERLYQKVIREKPSFELVADAATNLGSVFLELNRVGDALDYFELAIKTNPTASDAHFNRGVVLQDIERLPEAIESYLAASAIDPHHAGALSNLASAYHAQGNHKAAAQAYETAIIVAADPDHSSLCARIGT